MTPTEQRANGRPARSRYSLEDIRETYKRRDAWWTVFLVDPLTARLMIPVVNRTNISPNQISAASFLIGCLAAACFFFGTYPALAGGAVLYHLSFVLDCMDGKVARLKGTGSIFGVWLDYSLDRYRVLVCSIALGYGQFQRTDDTLYIWLALAIVFIDMLRYLDALQTSKLRHEMDRRLRAVRKDRRARQRGDQYVVTDQTGARHVPALAAPTQPRFYAVPVTVTSASVRAVGAERPDLNREFRTRFRLWHRFRDELTQRRVRPHLFSGVEYQMFIFIIGPLLDAVAVLIIFSSVTLLVFEALIIYRLRLSTKEFDREFRRVSRNRRDLMTMRMSREADAEALDDPLELEDSPAP